ncbi:MAG: crosslink repair DNA glycosylase YcaQ family protein, partial [Bacillota bacterium]
GVGAGEAGPTVLRWYLRSYGPATWQDFAAWAGIPVREAVSLAGGLGNEVVEVSVEGRRSYLLREDLAAVRAAEIRGRVVRLLPSFDPYLLGHHEKDHLVSNAHYKRVFRKAGWLSPVVLVDGRVAGVWSHKRSGRTLRVTVEPFGDLPPRVREQIVAEAGDLGRFLDLRALTEFIS